MSHRFAAALAALFVCASAAHAAPLEAYGKLPSIERAEISPSGKLIAFVTTDGENRQVVIQSTVDHKTVGAARAGAVKLRGLAWAGDDHLILTTSTTRQPTEEVRATRREWFAAQDLNIKTGQVRGLLDTVFQSADDRHPIRAMSTIIGPPAVRMIGGKPVAFVGAFYFIDDKTRRGLFQVDLNSGGAVLVEPGAREAYDWAIDAQGQRVAEALYNESIAAWTLMIRHGSNGWRPAQAVNAPIDVPDLQGLGRDGKSVLVAWPVDEAETVWRELSLESGAWGDPLPGEANGAIFDPISARLIGQVAYVGDALTYTFYDPQDAAVWRAVTKAFPGDIVSLASWSDDRKKIVVRVDSAESGPAYALVDLTTMHADWLFSEYVGVKDEDIAAVRPVRYKAADGLEISGYLTLPRNKDPHGLPLIVLAHGGPAARDAPGFDWWAQALASRGYAVLQANFRGSDGLGPDIYRAGLGQFGRKMQTDLSDGVRDLVRQGIVDAKRVCIAGGSYGGYAALAGASLDKGVYRCAASYAGPSDLRSQVNFSSSKGGRPAFRYWLRFIGAKDDDDPVLTQLSPAAHAADVAIPVLLIHGRDDTVVPISQSRRMADALRSAGKPVELVELPGEDHWLSSGQTRLQMLQAMVAFLEKYNPPN